MKLKMGSCAIFRFRFRFIVKSFVMIAFILFSHTVTFSQQKQGSEKGKNKTISDKPDYNEPVIPFVSPSSQSDWNIRRQTGRLVGANPVMFFDDDFILSRNNLTRTMHPLRKQGVIPGKLSYSEDLSVIIPVFQLLRATDGKSFLAFFANGYKGKSIVTLYRTIDGLNFEPVIINQVESALKNKESTEENITKESNVLPFFTDETVQRISATSFFEFPEGKEFKYGAFFINKVPRPRQTHLYGSMDGVNWKKIKHNHLTIIDETNRPVYDSFRDRYLAYLRHWDPQEKPSTGWRKVLLSESYEKDGELHFTDQFEAQALVLESDESDPAGADIYYMPVIAYAGKYVGLPVIYNRRMSDVEPDLLETLTIELAFSHDGYAWQRINQGKQFLPQGRGREWDSGITSVLGSPVIVNNQLLFHYSGTNIRHDENYNIPDFQAGIGTATLRVDGFVSMDAGPEGGTLVTVPFFPQGRYLYLNADASDGEIRVEVLQDGHSVELKKAHSGIETVGLFSIDKCIPITGDSIAHRVKWEHGENFVDYFPKGWNDELLYVTRYKKFEERAIVLKIHLKNAKLYSFWFADKLEPFYHGRLMP